VKEEEERCGVDGWRNGFGVRKGGLDGVGVEWSGVWWGGVE
jgi:hypothetical protein